MGRGVGRAAGGSSAYIVTHVWGSCSCTGTCCTHAPVLAPVPAVNHVVVTLPMCLSLNGAPTLNPKALTLVAPWPAAQAIAEVLVPYGWPVSGDSLRLVELSCAHLGVDTVDQLLQRINSNTMLLESCDLLALLRVVSAAVEAALDGGTAGGAVDAQPAA